MKKKYRISLIFVIKTRNELLNIEIQIVDLFVKGTTDAETNEKTCMIVIDVKRYFNNVRAYIDEKILNKF